MQNDFQPGVSKIYSVIFLCIFGGMLLIQFLGCELQGRIISEDYLWRAALVNYFNGFRFLIGDRVFSTTIVGKDKWLFHTGEISIQDYQNTVRMNETRLKELVDRVMLLDAEMTRNNGVLVVVIPPNKSTVYQLYMPDQIPVLHSRSRMDQLVAYLDDNKVDLRVVDPRKTLMDASEYQEVYYKFDTHWNCPGAYIAYSETMKLLSNHFEELYPRPLSDFDISTAYSFHPDLSTTMGLSFQDQEWQVYPKFTAMLEEKLIPVPKGLSGRVVINNDRNLPVALTFHDSFYLACFKNFFEPHFSHTMSVPYIAFTHLSDYLDLIDEEKPDVLIVEFTERYIENFLNNFVD